MLFYITIKFQYKPWYLIVVRIGDLFMLVPGGDSEHDDDDDDDDDTKNDANHWRPQRLIF